MAEKPDHLLLNYIERGNKAKTSLVFLHFFGGSSKTWVSVLDKLEDRFHCIAIDLSGWGDSQTPKEEITVASSANLVIELLEHLHIENFVLVGHSMGGKVALFIASQLSSQIQSIILVAPSPPTPEPMTEKARQDMVNAFEKRDKIEKLVVKITADSLSGSVFEKVVEDHLRASFIGWNSWAETGSKEDISGLMSMIEAPLLVISGSEDPNFSSQFLKEEFTKYFAAAKFSEISGSAHLIPVEAPAELAKLIAGNFS